MKNKSVYDDLSSRYRKINKSDAYYISRAAHAGECSSLPHQHGSVIVERDTGRIISSGFNHIYIFNDRVWTIHSEVHALRQVRKGTKLKNCVMYNVSIGNSGVLRISKPCVNCNKALTKAGIEAVYFTI